MAMSTGMLMQKGKRKSQAITPWTGNCGQLMIPEGKRMSLSQRQTTSLFTQHKVVSPEATYTQITKRLGRL